MLSFPMEGFSIFLGNRSKYLARPIPPPEDDALVFWPAAFGKTWIYSKFCTHFTT